MFNAQLFSNVLKNIVFYYDSIRDFSKASGFNRTSLSEYIRCRVKNPPSPEVLKKIADNSNGTVSYIELMQICGYLREDYVYPECDTRYNQGKLIKILRQMQGDKSLNDFARDIDVDSSILSRIMTYNRTNPPSPRTLRKIANCSYGITTYVELLLVCGYLTEEDIIEINGNKVEDDNKLCVDLEISNLRIPNFEETEEKVKNLVSLLERADELIKSLSKK